jgi:transcriptional regulator with XRE-family HTH domain
MQTLEERIKELRGDLSQQQFGEAVGIPQQKLSRLETGKAPIDLESTQKLCNLLGVNADWLLFGRGPKHSGETHCHESSNTEEKDVVLIGEGKELYVKMFEELRESSERERQAHERERELMQKVAELSVAVSEKNAEIEKLTLLNNSLVEVLEEKMFAQNQSKEMNDMPSDEKKTS